jgi:hypothetical protein
MTWLQELLEGLVVYWLCQVWHIQCCFECHDTDCCDNLRWAKERILG